MCIAASGLHKLNAVRFMRKQLTLPNTPTPAGVITDQAEPSFMPFRKFAFKGTPWHLGIPAERAGG